jgi:hypothetical protein
MRQAFRFMFAGVNAAGVLIALIASPLSRGLITRAAVQGEYLPGLTGDGNTISDAEQIGVQVGGRKSP